MRRKGARQQQNAFLIKAGHRGEHNALMESFNRRSLLQMKALGTAEWIGELDSAILKAL